MENFNNFVTVGAAVAGAVLLGVAIIKIWSEGDKWPIVGVLGVGAFLLVGSQYKSFKISATGLEALRNDVAAAASAAADVAAQTEQAASAVQATQSQVDNLTVALEKSQALPAATTRPIRASIRTAPRVDVERLKSARSVLNRIQQKSTAF